MLFSSSQIVLFLFASFYFKGCVVLNGSFIVSPKLFPQFSELNSTGLVAYYVPQIG